MSNVFFIGDLHLDHAGIDKFGQRVYDSMHGHNQAILDRINDTVRKQHDILFLMGDIAFSRDALDYVRAMNGRKILIRGNHDQLSSLEYLAAGIEDIHGIMSFKEFWLTHAPIHPQEMYRRKGNIHGHIHDPEKSLGGKYINVNLDALGLFTDGVRPLEISEVREILERQLNGEK